MKEFRINGVNVAAPRDAVAYKYAEPVADACWLYDEDVARRIEAEDASLIVWPREAT